MSKIGRNDACPCGSGLKHKKCCLLRKAAAPTPENETARSLHALDERLFLAQLRVARRMEPDWYERIHDLFWEDHEPDEESIALVAQWGLFHAERYRDEETGAQTGHFLALEGRRLSPDERAWLDAQNRAWLSIWRVEEVQAGIGMQLHDLLTGERRYVHEESGSRGMAPGAGLLCRVVDHRGVSVLAGLYARPLRVDDVEHAVSLFRELWFDHASFTPDDLRDEDHTLSLVHLWNDLAPRSLRSSLPTLVNFDGDPLEWHDDIFEVAPSDRASVLESLSSLDGADLRVEDGETLVLLSQPGKQGLERTHVGRISVGPDALRLETNSARRADTQRGRIELACGPLVRHRERARKTIDLASLARGGSSS